MIEGIGESMLRVSPSPHPLLQETTLILVPLDCHPPGEVQDSPKALDLREPRRGQQVFVPLCRHRHQHSLQRHSLPLDVVLAVAVNLLELPVEVGKQGITLAARPHDLLDEDHRAARQAVLEDVLDDPLPMLDGSELQGQHAEGQRGGEGGVSRPQVQLLNVSDPAVYQPLEPLPRRSKHRRRDLDPDVLIEGPELLDEGGQRLPPAATEIDDGGLVLDELAAEVEAEPPHVKVAGNRPGEYVIESLGHVGIEGPLALRNGSIFGHFASLPHFAEKSCLTYLQHTIRLATTLGKIF